MARQSLVTLVKNLARIIAARPEAPPSLEHNQLLQTILNRRSIRKFSQEMIPDDVLKAILEAGRLAPAAVNFQTFSFFVFTDRSWPEIFGRAIPFGGNRAILVLADTHRGRKSLAAFPRRPLVEYTFAVINASLAAMTMNIAAEALGVGSVMITETGRAGYLDAVYLKEKLSLPSGVMPLLTLVLGYPKSGRPPMPPKLSIDQICFTAKYRNAEPKALNDWLAQMYAGYKAAHPLSSFDSQLELYLSKIDRVERDLQDLVYFKEREDPE
jgi:FMN reductase (NADPH)